MIIDSEDDPQPLSDRQHYQYSPRRFGDGRNSPQLSRSVSSGAFQPKFRPQSKVPERKIIRTSALHSSKKKDKFLRVQELKKQTFSDKP